MQSLFFFFFSKTIILALIHGHVGLHILATDQGNHFTANEVWHWAHTHGIYWSYHVPHLPETTGLIGQWNGLLKTQLQHQLDGNV